MRQVGRALLLACSLTGGPLMAQEREYVPVYDLPKGREIVALYIGSTTCGPCLSPEVKAAVRKMKVLVADQAKAQGASFAAVGVANDWKVADGTTFLEPLGTFDQVVVGGSWTNLAIERYVWRDPQGVPAMPQILVIERTITTGPRIEFSEPKLLRRVTGGKEIPAWVENGAPISATDTPRP
jgi:hypothetical protein